MCQVASTHASPLCSRLAHRPLRRSSRCQLASTCRQLASLSRGQARPSYRSRWALSPLSWPQLRFYHRCYSLVCFRSSLPFLLSHLWVITSLVVNEPSQLSSRWEDAGITQENSFFVRSKCGMLEAERTGELDPFGSVPAPRQAFTHAAGTPNSYQCSGWVLLKSASSR